MADSKVVEEIRELLMPFVNNDREADDPIYDEDVEDLIIFAKTCHAEEEYLAYLKEHPDGPFRNVFFNLFDREEFEEIVWEEDDEDDE